ncbi:MAG: hypothetical protein QW818_00415 [Candidatus Aenigmatarchaeota archaeon]|nr:hypothetical protein [Candidatus Aenigmarchaeota archaeon]
MSSSYKVLRIFSVPELGRVELVQRYGYNSYHLRVADDRNANNRNSYPPRIPNRDARALLSGINPENIVRRYGKRLRNYDNR